MKIPESSGSRMVRAFSDIRESSHHFGAGGVMVASTLTEEGQNRRRWSIATYSLGVIAGLAMMLVGFELQSLVSDRSDPYFFGEMGKSLARGQGFEPYGVLLKRRAPLYPMVIGGIYSLFGEDPRFVQLLQCL